MSPAQVQSLFPSASRPAEPQTLGGGASCELALNGYEVGGDKYQVCFYFKAAKLVQVMLSGQSPKRPQFDTVLELLRSKYGAELESGEPRCNPGVMTKCEANWSLKTGTNVGVLFMEIGDSEGVLNIYYQTRIASDASKL